jgi:hypothetical protein
MDELLRVYATSAAAHASAVNELSLLAQMRHTRSAFLAAFDLLEKTWQECELARLDFRQPGQLRLWLSFVQSDDS